MKPTNLKPLRSTIVFSFARSPDLNAYAERWDGELTGPDLDS
jgi:hypothetical protein